MTTRVNMIDRIAALNELQQEFYRNARENGKSVSQALAIAESHANKPVQLALIK